MVPRFRPLISFLLLAYVIAKVRSNDVTPTTPDYDGDYLDLYDNSTSDLLMATTALPGLPKQPRCNLTQGVLTAYDMKQNKDLVILGIAIVGNAISLFVNAPKMFKNSPSCYMTMLAIFDMLTIITWTVRFKHRSNNLRTAWGDVGCKVTVFACYYFRAVAVNILVIMTIERSLIVMFPLKLQSKVSAKSAASLIALTAFFFFCFHSPLFDYVFELHTNIVQCAINRPDWWATFDLVTTTMLPCCLLFCCNGIIIGRMRNVANMQEKMTNDSSKQSRARKQFVQITIQTLTVSISFLFLTMPLFIYMVPNSPIYPTTFRKWVEPGEEACYWEEMAFIYAEVAYMLFQLNHSVNGFLYGLFSRMFRQELARNILRIFCPGRVRDRLSKSSSNSKTAMTSMSVNSTAPKQQSIATVS